MKKPTIQTGFRLPPEVIERIDDWVMYLEQVTPGLNVSRSEALRHIVLCAKVPKPTHVKIPRAKP